MVSGAILLSFSERLAQTLKALDQRDVEDHAASGHNQGENADSRHHEHHDVVVHILHATLREGSHLTFQAIALPEEEAVIEHVEYDRIYQYTQLQLTILIEEDVDERQGHHQEQHDEEFPHHTVGLETLCLAHQAQRIQFESGLWYCKRCQPEEVHREDGYHTGQHVNGLYALYHSS